MGRRDAVAAHKDVVKPPEASMVTLLLVFDLDGTLVDAHGSGRDAMTEAFARVFGVSDGFAGHTFAGQTDLALLEAACARHGLRPTPTQRAAFVAALTSALERRAAFTPISAMPGVVPLLADLLGQPTLGLAIGTGNLRATASAKLRWAGIPAAWLPVGGFGDDGPARAQIIGKAVARARGFYRSPAAAAVVVGDTPSDVAAAHANGLPAVTVATGSFTTHQLTAAGSDAVLPDLTDIGAFRRTVAALRG